MKTVPVMILSIIRRKNEMPLQLCYHSSVDMRGTRIKIEHKRGSSKDAKSDHEKKVMRREPAG